MAEISPAALFGKLAEIPYKTIESATEYCQRRGNPYVELTHWLHQILQQVNSDLHCTMQHFELDPAQLDRDLTRALDKLPRGASAPNFSIHVWSAVEQGWLYATLMYETRRVRSGHLLIGMLKDDNLRMALGSLSGELRKIRVDELTERFAEITNGSPEEQAAEPPDQTGAPARDMAPAAMGKQEALGRFTVDLTDEARRGRIDPIVGRDEEIRQVIDILMRRRQNNPILTGEAGVGKTAVVEGFAHRIVEGDVPPMLAGVRLLSLDIGLLQAGASMKGEFEQRLRQVIDEVQSSLQPIIMFIDEAHTLIGAGGAAGTGDAANLLKPALARGTLKTIAATTWAEYKKHIEKDPALTRRFQVVQVGEPDEVRCVRMMRKLANTLETHHRVQLLDEAIEAAVRLSHRYIPARQLPDKAVSVLDTACARVAVSQHSTPATLEYCQRQIESLDTELEIIEREASVGVDAEDRRQRALEQRDKEQARKVELEARFAEEKALVDAILALRRQLRGEEGAPIEASGEAADGADGNGAAPAEPADRSAQLAELQALQAKLKQLQGDEPLILASVDEQAVASVVGDWTGIPVGRMVKDEIDAVLRIEDDLKQRVIGQDHAMAMIAKRIQTARAGLDNPSKPIGVFLLCGPSGVGKTETALALAERLYGGEHNVVTINMSEFQEAHTVSSLKGSPPGYIGYGEGGVLTEAVRRKPYSVVLLDEVEKAHPDVHEIFFQVFDKGVMEDGEGRRINFKNTLILLTSNVGSDLIMDMCGDPDLLPEPEGLAEALRAPLLKVFPPALLGRLVVIPYYPLSDPMLDAIIRLQLKRIDDRLAERHGVPLTYGDAVIDLVRKRCTELESGGRMIDAILTNTVLPQISREFLVRMREERPVERVELGVEGDEFTYSFA
jgi:type VI secretion system protein VasG